MPTIGKRLASERKRLGVNQTDFAEMGGVKRASQVNYETDKRSPDALYWAAIAKKGADIQFILTGIESVNLNKIAEDAAGYQSRGGGSVSQEERGILKMYRELRPIDRTHARAVIDALACKNIKKDETG